MIQVTRRETFNAAHRLHNPSLSEDENKRLFGLCNNPNYHGHNYSLEVKVKEDYGFRNVKAILNPLDLLYNNLSFIYN